MSYLWTLVPFLIFVVIIIFHERKRRPQEVALQIDTERFMRPVARTTSRMFEKQYGRPSTEMENTFPDINKPK